jgi:hypothetical protein
MESLQVCKIVAHRIKCKDSNGTTSDSLVFFKMKTTAEKHCSSSIAPRLEHMLFQPTLMNYESLILRIGKEVIFTHN